MGSELPSAKAYRELKKRCQALEAETQALKERAEGLENLLKAVKVRPILITTMPKSGTYYISNVLAQGLNTNTRIVSNQYFPYDTIRYFELKALAENGEISQDHFNASPINLTHISRYFDRLIVHVRDPRQAMLSWIHYIEEFADNPETYLFIYPPLPDGYFEMDLTDKIDWGIENWLPSLVEWTQEWVRAARTNNDIDIKITHYEDLIRSPEGFMRDMVTFCGIPQERFIMPRLEASEDIHFRKGDPDEWRSVFTSDQIAAANGKIPRGLARNMNWSRAG